MKEKLLPSLVCTSVIVAAVEGRRVHQSVKLEVPATECINQSYSETERSAGAVQAGVCSTEPEPNCETDVAWIRVVSINAGHVEYPAPLPPQAVEDCMVVPSDRMECAKVISACHVESSP